MLKIWTRRSPRLIVWAGNSSCRAAKTKTEAVCRFSNQMNLLGQRKLLKVVFDDVHRARITGPVKLKAAEIRTPDLRAGASILIASLVADGQSIIYNAEIIDRGYERLDERLNQLGAKIERTE